MIIKIILTVILCTIANLLQSTLLGKIAILNVVPDLALCILVYSAYVNGTMPGQISGFFSGISLDLLSAAPLGLNGLVRTLVGALAGLFKGMFFLDSVFMPVILCILATLVKAIILLLLNLIFGPAVPSYSFISAVFWLELGMNAVLSPFLFMLLKKIKPLSPGRR